MTQPRNSGGAKAVERAMADLRDAQERYDAKPGIETAMVLDHARRELFVAQRDLLAADK